MSVIGQGSGRLRDYRCWSEEVLCLCVVGYLCFASPVLTGFTVSVTAGGTVALCGIACDRRRVWCRGISLLGSNTALRKGELRLLLGNWASHSCPAGMTSDSVDVDTSDGIVRVGCRVRFVALYFSPRTRSYIREGFFWASRGGFRRVMMCSPSFPLLVLCGRWGRCLKCWSQRADTEMSVGLCVNSPTRWCLLCWCGCAATYERVGIFGAPHRN